jgi:tetratricopeptide (TPR) repeat protein
MIHDSEMSISNLIKKTVLVLSIFFFYFIFIQVLHSKESNSYVEGISLFKKKEYEKSKFFFEKDIVFNPKNNKSYLFLAKIFSIQENEEEEEINLSNTLLLDPNNDEALYMMIILKIKQSDYNETKELIEKFNQVCDTFCIKKKEIEKKFKALIPENAKTNN